MTNVIDARDKFTKRPLDGWRAAKATCHNCQYTWVAVAPVEASILQCPRCYRHTGQFNHNIDYNLAYECDCKCDTFSHIIDGTKICVNCGKEQR